MLAFAGGDGEKANDLFLHSFVISQLLSIYKKEKRIKFE
jgi:hypothetical protein